MENSRVDENRSTSLLGITDDSNEETINVSVDPITDEVLVDLIFEYYPEIVVSEKIDENRQNIAIFVTDDINEDIVPVIINPNNNRLLVDLSLT